MMSVCEYRYADFVNTGTLTLGVGNGVSDRGDVHTDGLVA